VIGLDNAIELRGITKTFGNVAANSNISLSLRKGEILALLGENGSGKTTLMNMLSGIYYPDSGRIFVDGREVSITSPKDSLSLGIGMIHQHFKLVDVLTAAENIVLGLTGKGLLNLKKLSGEISGLSKKYGFELAPDKKVYDMSVSEKQTVEIVKVLYRGARVLILDEPTAVLTPQETDRLFAVLRNMKKDGKAIVIITHKLNEVMEISDRVAVLRKGEYVAEADTDKTDPQTLTDMMLGRAVSLDIERTPVKNPRECLRVEDLCCVDAEGVTILDHVSFSARSGEILGVAGIAGSGQRELCEAIAGLYPIKSGSISYFAKDGEEARELVGRSPLGIRRLGISLAFVPEDRLGMGLVAGMGIVGNMMLRSYRLGKSVFAARKPGWRLARTVVERLGVSAPSVSTPVRKLSGGNVQKVLLGREISSEPTVIMAAYPVRGLDVNSSFTIYRLLNEQKEKNAAVIFIGEDLDVLLELCDRILVLCGGKASGIVDARTASKEQLGLMMMRVPDVAEGGER
jgi:simple sugar transport system ATP-binding protein